MDNKIRIFIVEDEALIAENVKLALEDLGYEIAHTAYSYEDAISTIPSCVFDLLLLDINLGDHLVNTGLDIARQLPQLNHVPFVFLTALSDSDTIIKASKLNPSAYLVKPAGSATLFAAIQTAIENFNTKKQASFPGEATSEIDHFYCKAGSKLVKVMWSDVYAVVAIKNYVKLLTPQNNTGFLIRASLQHTLTKLIPLSLQRNYELISRNTLLNPSVIKVIKPGYVVTPYGDFETTKRSKDISVPSSNK